MRPQAWAGVRGWAWAGACAAALALSTILALTSDAGGNVAFVVGAALIVASTFFVGTGGERRFRVVRGLFGEPAALEPRDPTERRRQISVGMKVFLLGVALWAPLAYLALRGG